MSNAMNLSFRENWWGKMLWIWTNLLVGCKTIFYKYFSINSVKLIFISNLNISNNDQGIHFCPRTEILKHECQS